MTQVVGALLDPLIRQSFQSAGRAPWSESRTYDRVRDANLAMSKFRNIPARLSGRVPANLAIRLGDGPLCSFTFDDCPLSALEGGGRMLEQAGVAGTFFVAGGLLNDDTDEHPEMLRRRDLAALVGGGHELGCHTYSHQSVLTTSRAALNADLDRNREVLLEASGAESLVSFAYPFGEVSWSAKAEISRRFGAARGVRQGINGGILDLSELRAVPIYSAYFSDDAVRALLRRTVRSRGWLIFYTHDVQDSPGTWGCTPDQFARVLELVLAARIEVLPVRSALGRLMHRG
jgi:peptidoglycan/xylan/chitin deacetylase (PgdA/CDA1 family)